MILVIGAGAAGMATALSAALRVPMRTSWRTRRVPAERSPEV